jgi:hypothetical protein
MKRRFVVWWYTYRRGGRLSRTLSREIRKERIKKWKNDVMHDLMVGHNIGDFTIQNSDLEIFIKLERNPTIKKLDELYKRYRGNELGYRG